MKLQKRKKPDQVHQLMLFGSGTRLMEELGGGHVQLETIEVIETKEAIHLRFRVIK